MIEPTPSSNLTPNWQKIGTDYPEVHGTLQQIAEEVYEQVTEPLGSGVDETDLLSAVKLGYLEVGDEGVSFSEPDVRRDYLIRHVANVGLLAWEEPVEFAEAIANAQRRIARYSNRRNLVSAVLLVLAYEYGRDVVGCFGELARSATKGEGRDRPFWNLYTPFCEALPELEVDAVVLAETLEAVSEAVANDGMAGSIYNAVERLAARSWAEGDVLYETLASRPDLPRFDFLPAILIGLGGADLDEAHRRALDLSIAAESASRKAGITALSLFKYPGGEGDHLLEATWTRLERGRSEPDPEVDHALVRAYGNLVGRKPEAKEALVDFSTRPDHAVWGPLSWILFQESDEAYGEPWFSEALLNMAVVPTSYGGIVQNLDHALYRVARENPDLTVEFMERMILGRDYGGDDESGVLPEMLHGAFSELVRHHPGALEEAVTRWFASSERRLHRAARDLVHDTYDISGSTEPWLRLSQPILDGLEEQTIVYTLQRTMGHIFGSRSLAALLLSATRREPCSRELLSFIAGALGTYVLYNYPHEGGEYLKKRIEADDVTDAEAEVARAAVGQSEAYLAALRDLPLMKEFQPPSQHQYLLRLAEHKQQTSMMDKAKQSSVLLNIMPELPLKYGRSHFMEREGSFTEPSELVPFSISAEKPRGEILDPVGMMFQRLRWQSAGLREVEDTVNRESKIKERNEEVGDA